MTNNTKRVKVDLRANESLTVEVPLDESGGEPMFAKLYLWLRTSGNLAKMSGAACKMYCALLTRADFDQLDCFPSQNRIADDAGISRRVVSSATRELVELGLISKISGRSKLGNKVNRYVITKPPLVQKSRKASAVKSQPLCNELRNPCAEIAHKQDSMNNNHTTTTNRDVGSSGDEKYLMIILERIEREFTKAAVNASVNIDEIAVSFQQYSEREIVGQMNRCNEKTQLWSGLEYWLENYGKSRTKTKVSAAGEVEAQRARLDKVQQRAQQPKSEPPSRGAMIATAKKGLVIAEKDGDEFWIKHHSNRLANLLK